MRKRRLKSNLRQSCLAFLCVSESADGATRIVTRIYDQELRRQDSNHAIGLLTAWPRLERQFSSAASCFSSASFS